MATEEARRLAAELAGIPQNDPELPTDFLRRLRPADRAAMLDIVSGMVRLVGTETGEYPDDAALLSDPVGLRRALAMAHAHRAMECAWFCTPAP
jgi:hypothetical protein